MKQFLTFILLLTAPIYAVTNAQNAAQILDQAVQLFRQSDGTEVEFTAVSYNKGARLGETDGSIQLKENKFRLETADAISWFDGKTQWSLIKRSNEVNITEPTTEEQQNINPYALLSLHHNGNYSVSMGSNKQYRGLPVHEIILKAPNSARLIQQVTVCLNKETNEPVLIRVSQSDDTVNEIIIKRYRPAKKWNNSHFKFNAKNYPSAEIIDLR